MKDGEGIWYLFLSLSHAPNMYILRSMSLAQPIYLQTMYHSCIYMLKQLGIMMQTLLHSSHIFFIQTINCMIQCIH